jgi:hypothetical protein
MDELLKVDVRAMQQRNADLGRGMDNLALWTARWFAEGLLLALGLFFVVPAAIDARIPTMADLTSRSGLFLLVMSGVMAGGGTMFRYRNIRRLTTGSSATLEEQANKLWLYLVGPGWLMRTARTGLMISLGVGIPIGLLLAFALPESELQAPNRALTVLAFTGMTAAWAFPMAFVLRWFAIRSQRKLMYDPTSGDTVTP